MTPPEPRDTRRGARGSRSPLANPMPLVTAIIPNYNYARYLRLAIDSALAQTHPDVEVVVVDDSSTDDSRSILATYGDRIRWFSQKNAGVSAARNRAIREARGAFIGVLDADDVWHPDKIERQLALMQGEEVGLVHCFARLIDADGNRIGTYTFGQSGWLLEEHAHLRPTVNGGGSGALIRRRVFDEVGTFDPGLSTSADWDMWRRVISRYRIELVREELIDYRIHASAMHLDVDRYERDMLRALDRMFTDPLSAAARPYQRHAYSQLYFTLAAELYGAKRYSMAARRMVHSLAMSPGPAMRLVSRKLGRALFAENVGPSAVGTLDGRACVR